MKLRSRQLTNLTMTGGTGSVTAAATANPNGTVLHAITQHQPNIIKFAGRVNGVCNDIDTFLESLDAHLDATNVTDPSQRLKEAKSFLDLSKGGDINSFTAGWTYRKLATYDEFKGYLRDIYGRVTSSDTVKSLSKIFRNAAASQKDYISFAGELYNELNSFKLKVQTNQEWFQTPEIHLDNLCSLIHMSLVLAHLPKALTESFKEPLKKSNDIVTIQHLVSEYRNKIVDLDQSKLDPCNTPNSRIIANVTSSSPARASTPRSCKYCSKTNHSEPQCYQNPTFCGFHKTNSHSAKDCLVLKNKFNRGRSRQRFYSGQRQNSYRQANNYRRRSPSNNYRRRNTNTYRANSSSRSNSGPQNFQSSAQLVQNT